MEPERPLREPSVEEDAVAADDDEAGARMEPQPTLLLCFIHPPGLLHGMQAWTPLTMLLTAQPIGQQMSSDSTTVLVLILIQVHRLRSDPAASLRLCLPQVQSQ